MDNFKFMDSWPAWVRWVLVLPVAAAGYGLKFLLATPLELYYMDMGDNDPRLSIVNPLYFAIFVICSALFVWCGAATAPRFKLLVALVLAPVALAFAGFHFATYPEGEIAMLVGVVVACGLIVWGYLRRRQAGLPSR
jgi:hypothetical protein